MKLTEITKIKTLIAQILQDNDFIVHVYQINDHDIDFTIIGKNTDYLITVNTVEKE